MTGPGPRHPARTRPGGVVIGLGLRLAVTGGRAAVARLALVGAAVAIGVALLLGTLAGINAVSAQNLRYAWLNSAVTTAATGPEAADPAWWAARRDYVRGDELTRIDVARTGPQSPVPPGMPALPGPGEFYASPALSRLLATTPATELGDRWPGRQAGVLGDAALPSPDSLVVVVGRTPAEVARIGGATEITRFVSVDPSECDGCALGVGKDALILILSVVAAALLFPLLMFIGTATRLAAARREQRFAAMRLVGATPRQITVLAAVESTVAAAAGTLLGFALFLALRGTLATFSITNEPFFPGDLSLTPLDVLAVAVGVPLGAAVAARFALRRVRISPLGVTRRVTPRPPRAWRLIPLAAGLAELAYFIGRKPATTNGQSAAYLSGIFLVMIGLVVAGPYLTMLGSRLLARRARRPGTLIAGRRLADDPRAGFRAVSGLMLALFVTSVATGVIGTLVGERGDGPLSATERGTLSAFAFPDDRTPTQAPMTTAAIPAGLTSVPGVDQVQVVRLAPTRNMGMPPGLIACAELARTPRLGSCPPGAEVVAVQAGLLDRDAAPVWPAAPITRAELDRLPVLSVVVTTDGSATALERARTLLQQAYPDIWPPATEAEFRSDFARSLVQFQRLADVVIVASLLIAGCSLAVSVTGGINERKRPFALLRLAGVRLAELRRVVLLESAVPLLAAAAIAAAAGFLAAHLFLRAQLEYTLRPPGPAYYVIVLLGLTVSLALITSTMPLLRRITGPHTARNE
jgi:hypothetical protein